MYMCTCLFPACASTTQTGRFFSLLIYIYITDAVTTTAVTLRLPAAIWSRKDLQRNSPPAGVEYSAAKSPKNTVVERI